MAKLSTASITGGYASTETLNANFAAIEEALENTLSRDGTSPNAMDAALDMDSNRLLNVGAPLVASDGARLADVQAAIAGLPTASTVPFTPTLTIDAVTTQGAVEEVAADSIAKALVDAKGDLLVGTAADTVARKAVGVNGTALTADSAATEGVSWGGTPELGQCRFTYVSTSSCQLSRHNGRFLFINGKFELVPASGPTVGVGGLAASTVYYIYAYMSGSTLTLEASTTVNATDATYGHQIKTGDGTRTLVGKAKTNASTQWELSTTKLHVLSYFNRRTLAAKNIFTANRTTTSVTAVELNTEIRCEFIAWPEDIVTFSMEGSASQNTLGASVFTFIGIDGVVFASDGGTNASGDSTGDSLPFAGTRFVSGFSGSHYATLAGYVGSGTGSWNGTSGLGSHLRVAVKG